MRSHTWPMKFRAQVVAMTTDDALKVYIAAKEL